MPANHTEIEKKLWASADELRANSHLKSSEYSIPVLGLIFLRFADQRRYAGRTDQLVRTDLGPGRIVWEMPGERATTW